MTAWKQETNDALIPHTDFTNELNAISLCEGQIVGNKGTTKKQHTDWVARVCFDYGTDTLSADDNNSSLKRSYFCQCNKLSISQRVNKKAQKKEKKKIKNRN